MKVKVFIIVRCPECGSMMISACYRGNDIIQCIANGCPLSEKMYALPDVEIKEIIKENKPNEKNDLLPKH